MSTDENDMREGSCERSLKLDGAIREEDVQRANYLIQRAQWIEGYCVLCEAIGREHDETKELLEKIGRHVNYKLLKTVETPLHLAVVFCDVQMARAIIKSGGDLQARTTSKLTPLLLAIVNLRTNSKVRNGESMLNCMLRLLIRHGVDIQARTGSGLTALHLAAVRGHLPSMQALLNFDIDIDSVDNGGNTALHCALKARQYNAVLKLLKNGSNVSIVNKDKQSALQVLSRDYKHTIIHQQLIKMKVLDLYEIKLDIQGSCVTAYRHLELLERCKQEIEKMKSTKIDNTTTTFYDILTKHINQVVPLTRDEDIVKAVNERHLRNYPMYADMIKLRFKRAFLRRELYDFGDRFISCMIPVFSPLPHVRAMIINNLRNADLLVLETVWPQSVPSNNDIIHLSDNDTYIPCYKISKTVILVNILLVFVNIFILINRYCTFYLRCLFSSLVIFQLHSMGNMGYIWEIGIAEA